MLKRCFIILGWLGVQAQAEIPEELATDVPGDPIAWCLYTFEDKTDFDATDGARAGKVSAHETDILVSVPLAQWDKLALLSGAGWKWNRFEFSNLELRDYDLYSVTVPFDLVYTGVDDWTFWGNVSPGLFTDFDRVTQQDYRTLGYGMVMYQWTPRVQPALGLAYDREFGEDRLYPMGGVIWSMGRLWQAKLLFPYPQLLYAPDPRWLCFVEGRPAGNQWNLRMEEDQSEYDLKYESWKVGAGIDYRIWSDLWLQVAGGVDMDIHYEVRNGGTTLLNSGTDDTIYGRIGLLMR